MSYVKLSLLVLWLGCAHEAARPRSTLGEIPAAARETILARAGGAEVRTSREGADRYEASWFENGLEREIVVTASGVVVEQESEVRAENVPAVVRDAAVKALGSGTIKYVLLGDGRYEAETVVDGKEREVVLTATGALSNGDDDDDDDDDDSDGDDHDSDEGHNGT